MVNVKTIKPYSDKETGVVYEVDTVRSVSEERAKVLIEAGVAVKIASKNAKKDKVEDVAEKVDNTAETVENTAENNAETEDNKADEEAKAEDKQ